MAGEVARAAAAAAARLTGVPVIPGGIRRRAASSSARMPFSVRPAAATGEEGAGELMPRVVFQGAPTLEEAREATSELIVGLEHMSPWSHYESGSSTRVHAAFRLLRENSEVQNVVASIASDPNVVNAVRVNPQLQEFLRRRRWASSHSVTGAERLYMLRAQSIEYSSNDSESQRGGFNFADLLNIIQYVVDMFRNLFGGEGANSSANGDHGAPGASGDHGAPGASAEHVIEASLLGLAIMVIMLIFLRRG